MRPIEQIRDPDQLKRIALLLQHENTYLHDRLVALTRRIDEIEAASKQSSLILEIAKLQEQTATFQKKLFAESSERRPRSGSDASGDPAPAKRRGHGPREQKQLPIELVVHELAADQRGCPSCGNELEAWAGQTEDGDEITVVERSFKLVRHQRQKYRCACNGAVVTAPGPAKLIPGGRYSVEFAADVTIAKHLDHMPYERQCRVMAREGLVIDSHTLWDQVNALAVHLAASYEALPARILASPVVHADETWWRVMGKSSKRWWVWCLTTKDAVFYRILESRSAQAARAVLGDYRGIVLADGYGAYESLSRAGPGFTLAHCWAHVRRKWIEAEPFYPDECAPVIGWISELYAIEAELRDAVSDVVIDPPALDQVRSTRDARSRPIVAKIHAWALGQRATPQSSLRKAIEYMLGIWKGLTLFLDDPRIPLDNNPAERALRGPVLGRKNFYGSRSRRGTEVAALFYSLIETAKLCGVEPKRYLVAAAQAAIARPGTVLLPHDLIR